MDNTREMNELPPTSRNQREIEDWIFSMVPVGVAFFFYVIFIMSSSIEPKELFLIYGAAAGFIGLESYWVVQGWRNKQMFTAVMGVIGIVVTTGLLYLYRSFA